MIIRQNEIDIADTPYKLFATIGEVLTERSAINNKIDIFRFILYLKL